MYQVHNVNDTLSSDPDSIITWYYEIKKQNSDRLLGTRIPLTFNWLGRLDFRHFFSEIFKCSKTCSLWNRCWTVQFERHKNSLEYNCCQRWEAVIRKSQCHPLSPYVTSCHQYNHHYEYKFSFQSKNCKM